MNERDEYLLSEYYPRNIAGSTAAGKRYTSKRGWDSLLDIASAEAFGCQVHIQPNFVKSGKSGFLAQATWDGEPVEGFRALFRNKKAWLAAQIVVETEDWLDLKLAELTAG